MTVHDILNDVPDDLTSSFSNSSDSESPLCVPQDRIEDIELYSIFLDGFNLYPECETDRADIQRVEEVRLLRKRVTVAPLKRCKRRRSKREVKGKRVWSINDVCFGLEGESDTSDYKKMLRCSHCQTTETPQWRMGPNGPKSLCNACGVRYKSGRLLAEYRPATSPTFNSLIHSNFHRNIMKMRH